MSRSAVPEAELWRVSALEAARDWPRSEADALSELQAAHLREPGGHYTVWLAEAAALGATRAEPRDLVAELVSSGVLGDPPVLLVEAETLVGLTLRGHPDQARGPDGAAVV